MIEKAGLDEEKYSPKMDKECWPGLAKDLRNVFRSKNTSVAVRYHGGACVPGEDTQSVLKDYWFDQTEIEGL